MSGDIFIMQPLYVVPVHAMKAYGVVDVEIHEFLMLLLDLGGWWLSCYGCFISRESPSSTHSVEIGWAPEPVWMLWRGPESVASAESSNP
jgi:hypothetical protein